MRNKKLTSLGLIAALLLVVFSGGCKKKARAEKTKVYTRDISIEKPTEEVVLSGDGKGRGIIKFFDKDTDQFFLEDDGDELRSPKEMAQEIEHPLLDLTGEGASSEPGEDKVFWADAPQEDSNFPNIYFKFNQHDVKDDQKANLEKDITSALKEYKEGKEVVVEGHACHSAGSRTYNLALSNTRAKEVAKQMKERGVGNVIVIGRGSDMPLVKGGDRDAQWANRRVQVILRST